MTPLEILNYKLKKVILAVKPGDTEIPVTEEDKQFILAQAQAKIQAYCHRRDIPEQAYYIWVDMAIDILRLNEPTLFEPLPDEDGVTGSVKSITVGDTSITLGKKDVSMVSSAGNTGSKDYDSILLSYANQLQAFRKIVSGQGDGLSGI